MVNVIVEMVAKFAISLNKKSTYTKNPKNYDSLVLAEFMAK